MKIEAGKFYKLRNGAKMRCYATDGGSDKNSIHGAFLRNGIWVADAWPAGGEYENPENSQYSITSEWVDAPTFDWSKAAAWHKWVAMDEDGSWYAFADEPRICNVVWRAATSSNSIPAAYAPAFSGDWKQSLIERPTA